MTLEEDTKRFNYVQKIRELEEVVKNQRHTIKTIIPRLQETLREKNLSLDALHFVWCSGGCSSGVHRYTKKELTEEIVRRAEAEVRRLRTWFINAHPIDTVRGGMTFRTWKYPPWHWRLAMWISDLSWKHYMKHRVKELTEEDWFDKGEDK